MCLSVLFICLFHQIVSVQFSYFGAGWCVRMDLVHLCWLLIYWLLWWVIVVVANSSGWYYMWCWLVC